MAYKIGQYIGLKDNSYMNLLDDGDKNESYLSPKIYTTSSQFSNSTISFEDFGFQLNTSLQRGNGYLFIIEVEKNINNIQDFIIKLKNDNMEMIIGAYRIEEGLTSGETEELKIVIIPEITNSTDIIFELQRTASDYSQASLDRIISLKSYKLYQINNKLDSLTDFNSRINLIKGMTIEEIDNNSDLSFIITGEEIKIGNDKFFELHEEMNLSISYLGFLIEPEETEANTPYFILNYKYE